VFQCECQNLAGVVGDPPSLSGPQKFRREVIAWRHLRHPNILPFVGVNLERRRFAMVSEWMDNGNIREYVEKHGGVNRVQLVSNLLDLAERTRLIRSAGRCCDWVGVHAQHSHGARRLEGGTILLIIRHQNAHGRGAGEYPDQSKFPCLSRGLWSLDGCWGGAPNCVWSHHDLSNCGSVPHVVHSWRDHSVDESRVAGSGPVRTSRFPTDKAVRLLRSRDGCV